MKKFLSLLLALSLVLSLSVSAFAIGGVLVDGDNEMELPWDTDEAVTFTYTATQTGTLYLSVEDFYYADGDFDYMDNTDYMNEFADYTGFTVDGQSLDGGYFGSVEVVEGQTYTISWEHLYATETWYKLGWKIVLNLSYTGDAAPQLGSEELPVELYTADCPTDSIEVPASGAVWYLLYDFGGAQFTVTGENAYVSMTAWNQETMEQEELSFEAENGVVTVPVGSYHVMLQIGNSGEESAVFGLNYSYALGTEKNPDILELGETVVTIEANNYDGYNFLWTAQCNGTLTLTLPEENWLASIVNLTAGGNPQWFDSTGENVITLEVSAGDEILFNINYIDELTYAFLGGEVKIVAAAEYDHEFVDGVCSHCGAQESDEEQPEMGDVNGDGRVTVGDARAILRLIAGLTEEGEVNEEAGDVNGDGRVTVGDARAILRKIAGLD